MAYGLEVNAIDDENSEFLDVAHKVFATSNWKLWFITFKAIFPHLFKYYEMPFLSSDVNQYFLDLTEKAINIRNGSTEKSDDYLNFLLKLKEKRNLQTVDVAAHSITFFLDAYETSSIILTQWVTSLKHKMKSPFRSKAFQLKLSIDFTGSKASFELQKFERRSESGKSFSKFSLNSIHLTNSALYRLAENKYCQDKLRQEIADCNGNMNFDILSNMNYLDQVFNGKVYCCRPQKSQTTLQYC